MENLKHAFLVPEPEASISEEHSEFEREHPDTLEAAEMPLAHAKMRHEQTTTEGNACENRAITAGAIVNNLVLRGSCDSF